MKYLAMLLPFCTGCILDAHYRNHGEPWSQRTILENALAVTLLILLGIVFGLMFAPPKR